MDISTSVQNVLQTLERNQLVSSVVTLFLVLYAGLAGPKLPLVIRKLFDSAVFRVLVLALVVYRGNKDPQLSIMIAVAFTLTMNHLREQELREKFRNL